MTAALEGGEWSASRSGRTLPLGKTRYPFYRRLGGPQGRSGRTENLFPTGIRSRTVQPVVSLAIPTELPGPQNILYLTLNTVCFHYKEYSVNALYLMQAHGVRSEGWTEFFFFIKTVQDLST